MIKPSIRLSLTLWYIGILAIILCGFSWLLCLNVSDHLIQQVDEVLTSQADRVVEVISVFWEVEQTPPLPPQTIRDVIEQGQFSELLQRWAYKTGGLKTTRPIRIIDRDGQSIIASAKFPPIPVYFLKKTILKELQQHTIYQTFQLQDYRIRLITRPVIEEGRLLYFVEVAASLRQVDNSLDRLRRWLLWIIPSTLLVASSVGWFLATKALRPVGQIIKQAELISAEDLHERIAIPQTGDELERLAVTFNNMLARLEQAFRRVRQFSAAASHELRTPLTVMKGELELTLRKPRDVQEYQSAIRRHLAATNKMAHTVEVLLSLARSETVEGVLEWRSLNLKDFIQKVCGAWRTAANNKKIRFDVSTETPVWVRADARLLERLLSNLLDNAFKHTLEDGCVTVRLTQSANHASLMVHNTGSNISSQELEHIFDKFFSRKSLPEGSDGLGLGLGLCRWIAEIHHGRIEVASSPHEGVTFTMWLPVTTQQA